MQIKHWAARLALGAVLFAGALACRTADVFIAQATLIPTRTPRPTFTPIPSPTATAVPTATVRPSPTATRKPTPRPTPRPTARPPTPIPPPPAATVFPYTFHAYFDKCEHSGIAYIKGSVFADKNDLSSQMSGVKLRLSISPDGASVGDVVSEVEYTFILSDSGPRPGTYYVWVIDDSGKRISEMSPPIVMNNLGPDNPNACWAAWLYFWKEPGR